MATDLERQLAITIWNLAQNLDTREGEDARELAATVVPWRETPEGAYWLQQQKGNPFSDQYDPNSTQARARRRHMTKLDMTPAALR